MKAHFRYLFLLQVLLFGGFAAQAQTPNGGITEAKRYRVTAFKMSNTSVTSLSNIAEGVVKSTFYIPSAFTPNGDGINDAFGVKARNITEFNLRIFNRWGELVFESDDINTYWDGTFKGELIANTDVFVYTVQARGVNGLIIPESSGTVTLVADGGQE